MGKHGNSCPRTCSQCAGVKPRIVEQQDNWLTVDGTRVRQIAEVQAGYGRRYVKRTGRSS